MPHLWSFRQGWQSENLARYILYKFSFVAQPLAVADDIGSDFYCTLFQIYNDGGQNYLTPTNAFAIQVKSNAHAFDVTDKLRYLEQLELPFFVGVADKTNLELTIYSGEYLPALFSHYGVPDHMEIRLCPRQQIRTLDDYVTITNNRYTLNFPQFLTIGATVGQPELAEQSAKMARLCSILLQNVSAKISHEYTFLIPSQ